MSESILRLDEISVHFKIPADRKGFIPRSDVIKAVDGLSLDVKSGEILGIVGESGCGKSTVARAIVNLVALKSGHIYFNGQNVKNIDTSKLRKSIQMIFQSPLGSLNPRMTVFQIISEPLQIHSPHLSKDEVKKKVSQVLQEVGLNDQFGPGYPHEFSGGQCQRIGIARALVLEPEIIICDEPISALDVSIQSQIINLLKELNEKKGLTLLFIAHDLNVVRHISDRILVMYLGKPVEITNKRLIYENPYHPYTSGLMSAIPILDPKMARQKQKNLLLGEIPSPINPPSGCVFRTRCPIAVERCAVNIPPFIAVNDDVSCACLLKQNEHSRS